MATTTTPTTDVRSRRLAAGLTQEQLAVAAGCSITYLARIDRGVSRAGAAFERVVNALDALDSPGADAGG
jgi:transcriptional regulator with XRE-family HTH domain